MRILNSNVFIVLTNIRDKDNDTGLHPARGTIKERIIEKSGLSSATVNRALKLLIEEGFIDEGIKKVNKKSYYVTPNGIIKLKEMKGRK